MFQNILSIKKVKTIIQLLIIHSLNQYIYIYGDEFGWKSLFIKKGWKYDFLPLYDQFNRFIISFSCKLKPQYYDHIICIDISCIIIKICLKDLNK